MDTFGRSKIACGGGRIKTRPMAVATTQVQDTQDTPSNDEAIEPTPHIPRQRWYWKKGSLRLLRITLTTVHLLSCFFLFGRSVLPVLELSVVSRH